MNPGRFSRPAAGWLSTPPRARLAPGLAPWLRDPGSLTTRIRSRAERFEVQVLRQARGRVLSDEAVALGLPSRQTALIREVLLFANGLPVVFARSVLPQTKLHRRAWSWVRGIGNRPLGAALFANPRIHRSPLHYKRLDLRDPRFRRSLQVLRSVTDSPSTPASRLPANAWARRSTFRLGQAALLVSEIFLPALLLLPADAPRSAPGLT